MDWLRFLEENNLHFVTRGPNTKRGEISIKCPMCGDDDPSEHLGINLQTEKWGCHRDASHRGKSSRTLIKAILACSSQQAGNIVKQYSHSDPDSLDGALAALEADNNGAISHEEDLQKQISRQKLGPQFNDFNQIKTRGITKRFFDYLVHRGYENPQDVIKYYDLRCALTGAYKDRIIIPVRMNGELLGWTSRALGSPLNAPRYLASSNDIKATIFNYDELKGGGERLFIVEGPFDAIRLDSFGIRKNKYETFASQDKPVDFRATCVFGTSVTMSQIILLRALVKKFKQAWILFDRGADGPASNLAEWIKAEVAHLPISAKDPGEMHSECLPQLANSGFWGHIKDMRDFARFERCFGKWPPPIGRKM